MNKPRKKVNCLADAQVDESLVITEGPQLELSSTRTPVEIDGSRTVPDASSLSATVYRRGGCAIYLGDALDFYPRCQADLF